MRTGLLLPLYVAARTRAAAVVVGAVMRWWWVVGDGWWVMELVVVLLAYLWGDELRVLLSDVMDLSQFISFHQVAEST